MHGGMCLISHCFCKVTLQRLHRIEDRTNTIDQTIHQCMHPQIYANGSNDWLPIATIRISKISYGNFEQQARFSHKRQMTNKNIHSFNRWQINGEQPLLTNNRWQNDAVCLVWHSMQINQTVRFWVQCVTQRKNHVNLQLNFKNALIY